jgi:hypothetical protein
MERAATGDGAPLFRPFIAEKKGKSVGWMGAKVCQENPLKVYQARSANGSLSHDVLG